MPKIVDNKPIIIAGPCLAESFELMKRVGSFLKQLSNELGFKYIFKASFDKANRTSIKSYRGPGIDECLEWFGELKEDLGLQILTDVHETNQVDRVASVCDYLQIPAFLCRQTDLLIKAVETGKTVNIKKGQFMAPRAMGHIMEKVREICSAKKIPLRCFLTERGTSFGYGDLVVDLRGFKTMTEFGVPVIFDITHSIQRPPGEEGNLISKGERKYAPLLARAAAATGYVNGFFMEVHEAPAKAKSDSSVQFSLENAQILLEQLIPLWRVVHGLSKIDEKIN